ncbi:DNA-binding NarL/FixJ family response regulator [Streptomyces sp. V4I23]|uniref:response regulator n=1 Tax=Streptomyces sp. V4I23 TaxID=3042282 RepID=UPI002787049B|nr:response regulator transcription factor [Streptomyces sp. V4I23]MDQ1010652.1 DNA-binding NarL/FixJ family response regulator [Streptomyces sp. V4I23]
MPYDLRPVRVLVVDDEELVRTALQQVLGSADGVTVAGTCDGPDAVDAVRALVPDLVLLDIDMPSAHGFDVLRALKALPRPPAVAMLTALDTAADVERALREGASGFLLKTTEPRMFTEAVRLLAAGGVVCTPSGSAEALSRYAAAAPAPAPCAPEALDHLTARERDVLALIAAGLSNADIAAHLGMGVTTVKTHIGALKRKLSVGSRVALATVVHRSDTP